MIQRIKLFNEEYILEAKCKALIKKATIRSVIPRDFFFDLYKLRDMSRQFQQNYPK